jgi:hypothetical protein
VLRWLVTANVLRSSPIVVTLLKEATRSSEYSFLTKATGCHISEEGIFLIKLNLIICDDVLFIMKQHEIVSS